jgi:predicted Zn-dependent peptidase
MKHTVSEHELSNGAKGLVINVPGVSVTNMVVYFKSGFMFGNPKKYEIPHVMEHLMASGNALHPTAVEFKTEVEKNGAYRNANTNEYLNGYIYECAAFEQDRMLKLLAAQITSPLFPEVSLPTEISNVREELSRMATEYLSVAHINYMTHAFPKGWAALAPRIEQLSTITHQDMVDFYQRTHTSKNMLCWRLL